MEEVKHLQLAQVRVEEIGSIRKAVSNETLSAHTEYYISDNMCDTHHFAVTIDNEKAICCASFLPGKYQDQPAWQLYGMTICQSYFREGIVSMLLKAEERLTANPKYRHVRIFWCNSHELAVPFFKENGWQVVSSRMDTGNWYNLVKRV